MACARPDFTDVEIASQVPKEQTFRHGVVVRGVPGFELDPRVQDRDETPSLRVERVYEFADGLLWVVDRIKGEVLPPIDFF